MIKIKNTQLHDNSLHVCKGRIILLPHIDRVGKSDTRYGEKIKTRFSNDGVYLNAILISLTEEILENDLYYDSGYCKEVRAYSCNDDDMKHLTGNKYFKVLAIHEHFSNEQLIDISNNKLKNGDDVFVECKDGQVSLNEKNKINIISIIKQEAKKEKKKELKPLDKELVKKIIADLKFEHKRRYGEKPRTDGMGYIPKIQSYKLEHLYDDLEFVLNHSHMIDGKEQEKKPRKCNPCKTKFV